MAFYIEKAIFVNRAPFEHLELDFKERGINVLAAVNGRGKTTILSHIIDAIYELAKKVFHNEFEGRENKYYRYSSPLDVTADTATFCFRFADAEAEQCVLVAPNERRVVSQFRFVAEGDDARYLLVVTDAPYAPQAIEMRLKNRMQPQAEPADGVCVVEEYR